MVVVVIIISMGQEYQVEDEVREELGVDVGEDPEKENQHVEPWV